MIAAVWRAGGLVPPLREAIGQSLSDRQGKKPSQNEKHGFACWGLPASGATLFFGRLDKQGDAERALGLPANSAACDVYAAALARWGDEADRKLSGHYCAITCEGPRRLRLVRSPWTAPPLHFVSREEAVMASPLLGALFAAGIERQIDWDYLADQLAYDHRDCEPVGWYENIGRVPLGSRIRIDADRWTLDRYYDPAATQKVRFGKDADYVERAQELLDDAARFALIGVDRPAMMLSGGLDSPLAACALLRIMPEGRALPSYTFGPHPDWDGWVPDTCMGDERGYVRAFAAMHPRIEPHFPAERGGHDYALRELLALTHVPTANIANTGIFHPLFEAAKADGCDAMMTALHGNFTVSLIADWAAPEALRRARPLALATLLHEASPQHSLPRRILSSALLPQFSGQVQRFVRRRFHPERFSHVPLGSLLSQEAASRWRERARHRQSLSTFEMPPSAGSRADAIRTMWASADSAEDLDLGMERLYGIAHRDVMAYRPLFEFCHGLPTAQLQRGRTDRYLARRMARGLMPESQRMEQREGRHNVDWHARLSQRRRELLDTCERLRGHHALSHILDLDRMQRLLSDWPVSTPTDKAEQIPREMGISRALTAAAFVSHVERRNDF